MQVHFWENGDSVIADRGFTIEDDLKPFNVKLNIPSFLENRDQLSHEEIQESQAIAYVRIHYSSQDISFNFHMTFYCSNSNIWTNQNQFRFK